MKRISVVFWGIVVVAATGIFAYSMGWTNAQAGLLRPDDAAFVTMGEKVYAAECASCHGANLEGHAQWRGRDADGLLRPPPHNATGHTWHHDSVLLFQLTKYGPAQALGDPNYISNMPAYEDILSDDEILAVLSFIKSTWPRPIRERHDELEKRR